MIEEDAGQAKMARTSTAGSDPLSELNEIPGVLEAGLITVHTR